MSKVINLSDWCEDKFWEYAEGKFIDQLKRRRIQKHLLQITEEDDHEEAEVLHST